jgi:3-deoxy-7-phosphoheptulonate synthase
MQTKMRGVRGAITVETNEREAILSATQELLQAIITANHMDVDDVASIFFSTTNDLNGEFPALAARRLGWTDTPLLCTHEMNVPHGMARVIRVLVHWNTAKGIKEIEHIYLRRAVMLRPDKVKGATVSPLAGHDGTQDAGRNRREPTTSPLRGGTQDTETTGGKGEAGNEERETATATHPTTEKREMGNGNTATHPLTPSWEGEPANQTPEVTIPAVVPTTPSIHPILLPTNVNLPPTPLQTDAATLILNGHNGNGHESPPLGREAGGWVNGNGHTTNGNGHTKNGHSNGNGHHTDSEILHTLSTNGNGQQSQVSGILLTEQQRGSALNQKSGSTPRKGGDLMVIVVMKPGATAAQIGEVLKRIEAEGFLVHLSRSDERTIIGVIGGDKPIPNRRWEALDGVEKVMQVTQPFKLASREFKSEKTTIEIGNVTIGGDEVVIMAGPCSVESYDQIMITARAVKAAGAKILRGGAFKPRSSPYDFQGMGEEGLKILAEARTETGLKIVTEVMSPEQVDLVGKYTDIFQIGARNMQNYALLHAVGEAQKPVLLKRGIAGMVKELLLCAEYILSHGNYQVMLCERGIRTYETATRNTFDINAIPVLQHLSHLPVIADPSHGVGKSEYVPAVARGALAAGADGIILEVHPDPANALSDGYQSLTLEGFSTLMNQMRRLAEAMDRSIAPAQLEAAFANGHLSAVHG